MSKTNKIKYKMTLDEFFLLYKRFGIKLGIKCPSIAEAYVLCNTLDEMGLRQANGRRYVKEPVDEWEDEDEPYYWGEDKTLYLNHANEYGSSILWKYSGEEYNIKEISFYDVDLTKYAKEWMFMVYKSDGLKKIWETLPHENPNEKYYNALDKYMNKLVKEREEKNNKQKNNDEEHE